MPPRTKKHKKGEVMPKVPKSMQDVQRGLYMLAKTGEPDHQFFLGKFYLDHTKHRTEGCRWLQMAAKQNHVLSQYHLGRTHLPGGYGPENLVEAARMIHLAAESGLAEAQYTLGRLYLQGGLGVERDFAKAARLFQLAIDADPTPLNFPLEFEGVELPLNFEDIPDGQVQAHLSLLYLKGKGVEEDRGEGLRLLELAAEKGVAMALFNLARFHECGNYGIEKNMAIAKEYYRRAAAAAATGDTFDTLDPDMGEFKALGQRASDLAEMRVRKITETCASCRKIGKDLKVCARCKGPRYCGSSCQKTDWGAHKSVCQQKRGKKEEP